MTHPRLTDLAQSLPDTVPFVGPETIERQAEKAFELRLGANESVFGPSPKAIAAMSATDHWKYGDPESFDLKTALAAHHGISFDNIVVGEGIDGLLGYLVRLLVGDGDAVVTSLGAYPTFNYHVAGFGGDLHTVPYGADYREDIDALLARAHEVSAKMIYLTNPDNPMGTWHDPNAITGMLDQLPEGCILVLDEAYSDFLRSFELPVIAIDDPRVIRMRTFSKAYGMAGARVGYAIGEAGFIRAFNKVRNHFGMNRSAQAGALAALADQAYLHSVVAQVDETKAALVRVLAKMGLSSLPSRANFIAIECPQGAEFADALLHQLTAQGVFIRKPMVPNLAHFVRLSIGTKHDMPALEQHFKKALSKIEPF